MKVILQRLSRFPYWQAFHHGLLAYWWWLHFHFLFFQLLPVNNLHILESSSFHLTNPLSPHHKIYSNHFQYLFSNVISLCSISSLGKLCIMECYCLKKGKSLSFRVWNILQCLCVTTPFQVIILNDLTMHCWRKHSKSFAVSVTVSSNCFNYLNISKCSHAHFACILVQMVMWSCWVIF